MANNFVNSVSQGLGSVTATTIYTPSPNILSATVLGCSIANTSMSPITVDVALVAGGTSYRLVRQATVPVGGALIAIGAEQKVVLEPGQTLTALPSTASACDVVVSALEITP